VIFSASELLSLAESPRDQNLEIQLDALAAAGCDKIITEKGSGSASKERPELDCLGRSTFKLLGLTEELQRRRLESTQAGLKAARKRGRIGGRPRVDKKGSGAGLKSL